MVKRFTFTHETVASAVCPAGRNEVMLFDGRTQGFGLRITAAGGKTFLAQYTTTSDKRRRRVVLGRFGALTVDQARKEALKVLGAVAGGADPFAEREASQAAARTLKAADRYTFDVMVQGWREAREGDRRASYLREAIACLRRNLPDWKERPAASITTAEAVRVLDGIKKGKGTVAANRTLAYGRAAYGWAVRRQAIASNPFKGIERPGRERARDRVLNPRELATIWRGCAGLSPAMAGFVRVLMLTMQRREEVASMRWAELDDAREPAIWTLPAERAKNGKAHIVHLSAPARAIIRALPRMARNPFVFAGNGAKPVAAFGYAKDCIIVAVTAAGAPVDDWRFHDFRRAGVTALAGMGFPPHVCDKLLNHVTGAITGVAAVYQRHEFLPERQAALEAWARHILAAVNGGDVEASNVLPLTRAAV